jgi:hypothetical protein
VPANKIFALLILASNLVFLKRELIIPFDAPALHEKSLKIKDICEKHVTR